MHGTKHPRVDCMPLPVAPGRTVGAVVALSLLAAALAFPAGVAAQQPHAQDVAGDADAAAAVETGETAAVTGSGESAPESETGAEPAPPGVGGGEAETIAGAGPVGETPADLDPCADPTSLACTESAPPPAGGEPPAGRAPDDVEGQLADLIGADLAAELLADEQEITGRAGGAPTYLTSTGTESKTAAVGGGGIGSSRLLNPAISLIATFAGTYFTAEDHVARGGHVPSSTGFHIVEGEFAIEAAIDPYIYLKGYFMFGPTFFETEEVYAETLRIPGGLKIRAGQMLQSFGRTNPTHPHVWEFLDAPLPNQRFFSGEGFRVPGVELSWLAPLPFYMKLIASAGTPAGMPTPGGTPDERTWGTDEDYDFIYTGRIETFVPFDDEWSLSVGASGATGPAGQGGDTHSDVLGGDVFLRYKPVDVDHHFEWNFKAEGMFRQRQFPGNRLADWGVYAEMMFRLTKEWRIAVRGDVAEGDLMRGATMTGPALDMGEERGSVSLTWVPSEFSLFRLQGNLSHPRGDTWTGEEWIGEFHLQAMFSVGAHGAHPF
ncbi:MAG: hypothetical protein QME96_04975 [Myxococcota bacterium]|nr:hypothetical protein [Myxococcota bacterium]